MWLKSGHFSVYVSSVLISDCHSLNSVLKCSLTKEDRNLLLSFNVLVMLSYWLSPSFSRRSWLLYDLTATASFAVRRLNNLNSGSPTLFDSQRKWINRHYLILTAACCCCYAIMDSWSEGCTDKSTSCFPMLALLHCSPRTGLFHERTFW